MKIKSIVKIMLFLLINFLLVPNNSFAGKIVSLGGYYSPINSISAITLAVNSKNTDYIYLSVSLSKDDIPIVAFSKYLQDFTDVEEVFPDRKREDGNYYSLDFTLKEINQLHIVYKDSKDKVNQQNFNLYNNIFQILTLQDAISLIKGLNISLSKNVGIYVFISSPYFNQTNGKDISKIVLNVLSKNSLIKDLDNFYLSLEDYNEIIRIKDVLLFKGDLILSVPNYKDKNYIIDTNPNNYYDNILAVNNLYNLSKYIKAIEVDSTYLFENSNKIASSYKNILKNLSIFTRISKNTIPKNILTSYNNLHIITQNP